MKIFTVLAALAATLLAAPLAAQTIVNIPGFDPAMSGGEPAPVTLSFAPGDYTAQVVGIAGGGLYDAWTVAQPAAGNYENRYNITANGQTTNVQLPVYERYSTATDALDAFSGILTSFTVGANGLATFSIPDSTWFDNSGGVSLSVSPANGSPTAVPEPATMGLFGLGAAALLARSRRKAKRSVA